MPSQQPDENMDKVLKAYAQKRRDDGGQMEMDLATRNMLQAEVARKLGPVPVVVKARPRFAWWPQIIMGVAGCAAVAIAVILWVPPQSRSKAKMVAASSQSVPMAAAPTTAVPSSGTPLTVSASDALGLETPKGKSSFDEWKKGGAVVTTAGNLSLGGKSEAERSDHDLTLNYSVIDKDRAVVAHNGVSSDLERSFGDTGKLGSLASREPSRFLAKNSDVSTAAPVPALSAAPATVAPPEPTGAAETRAVGGEVAAKKVQEKMPQANLRFSQIDNRAQYRRNLNSPPLPKVLTNFAVQRNGTNVSVMDSDGSVYNGNIVVNLGAESSRSVQFFDAFNGGQQNRDMPEDMFAFRVTGFNGKLREKIVFTGNVTNVITVTNGFGSNVAQQNGSQTQNANGPQQQSIPQNLFLNGRVQVGRRTEFDIQAAPTK